MPAAAVIPAPIAYTINVAVKKLVVGSAALEIGPPQGVNWFSGLPCRFSIGALNRVPLVADTFTLKKLECSKQADA